jgi:acetyl-CoA C-acetyltransferase
VILASEEVAKKLTDTPVWNKAIGFANGTANLSKRQDFIGLEAALRSTTASPQRR